MKGLLVLLALVGFSLPAAAQEMHTDVRGLLWGLPQADVKSFEEVNGSLYLGELRDILSFSGEDSGLDATIDHHFLNNELYMTHIIYRPVNSNPQENLNDYIDLKAKLAAIHGAPARDDLIWNSSELKNDPERWGLAVLRGALELESVWLEERTYIILSLRGGNMDYSLEARHHSRVLDKTGPDLSLTPEVRP